MDAARSPDGYASAARSYGPSSIPDPTHLSAADLGTAAHGHPGTGSPLAQSVQQPSTLGSAYDDLPPSTTPSRSGTLKKRNSLSRRNSLKRSGSRKSLRAGSIKGVPSSADLNGDVSNFNHVFYTPVPTHGTPTEVLANRFQTWRKFLKDLVAYFREVQNSYEQRSKALLKVSNVINNINAPTIFLSESGLNEASRILRDYHKQAIIESNKARDIENDVVLQLNGLRSDLGAKIKEIKSLSGDFKNSVEKEKDVTRKAIAALEEALHAMDVNPGSVVGNRDPYVVRLSVERQVERQIDEENYLHRAYLNLENSGRELEAIVVGEIQKAYNTLAGILKRDADEAYEAVERLRTGPIAMPKDHEWAAFIDKDSHFVSPNLPLRKIDEIEYPGKHHPAAQEVRAGTLERKSKYLKSYTPGWYVLSPTHLHEFKSPDYIYTQPPVMSLCLLEQKLGSHSQPGSSSHKFSLKGKQTGSMHRGHSWVFRAESFETMMAWYHDIQALTEGTGEQRSAFVRKHARSVSAGSLKASSISGDSGMEEDEADEVPYSANASLASKELVREEEAPKRPQPGGRFPSDIQVDGHLRAPLSPSSGSSDFDYERVEVNSAQHQRARDRSSFYGAGANPASQQVREQQDYFQYASNPPNLTGPAPVGHDRVAETSPLPYYELNPSSHLQSSNRPQIAPTAAAYPSEQLQGYPKGVSPAATPVAKPEPRQRQQKEWMVPATGGTAVAAAGIGETALAFERTKQNEQMTVKDLQSVHHTTTQPQYASNSIVAEPYVATYDDTRRHTVLTPDSTQPSAPVRSTPIHPNCDLEEPSRPTTAGSLSTLPSSIGESPFGFTEANKSTGLNTNSALPAVAGIGTGAGAKFDADAQNDAVSQRGVDKPGVPGVMRRKDTDISISNLHIPGEFPKGTPSAAI